MLVNRNITVGGHRTSIRLEPEFWAGLADIAQREKVSIDEICTEVDRGAGELSRTAAVRVFITSYLAQLARHSASQLSAPVSALESDYVDAAGSSGYSASARRLRAAG